MANKATKAHERAIERLHNAELILMDAFARRLLDERAFTVLDRDDLHLLCEGYLAARKTGWKPTRRTP